MRNTLQINIPHRFSLVLIILRDSDMTVTHYVIIKLMYNMYRLPVCVFSLKNLPMHPHHRVLALLCFSGWSLFSVEFFESFLLLNLSVVDDAVRGERWERNVLARICGRDKRVLDVIKLPREEEPAASQSELFHEEEESIGQQRRPYPPPSLFLLLTAIWKTRGRTSSQRSLFFHRAETCAFIYFPMAVPCRKITPLREDISRYGTQRIVTSGMYSSMPESIE